MKMNSAADDNRRWTKMPKSPAGIAILIGTALLLTHPALGQAPDLEWEEVFGGAKDERGLAIQETRDAGLIVAGYTASKGAGNKDLLLIKTDSEGEMEWERTIGGPGDDEGWAVLETKDGGYLIAGVTESWSTGGKDLWLVKTYSDGYERWMKTFGGPGDDWGAAVVETKDGGYAAVGVTTSRGSGGSDGWILKTDSDGNLEWDVAIGGSKNDGLSSIMETENGYLVAGTTESFGAGGKDVWLAKTDDGGNREWEKTFGKDGDEMGNFVLEINGGYVVIGVTKSEGSGGRDLWLARTDSEGEKVWENTFGGPGDDGGWAALETRDGDLLVVGYTESQGRGKQDLWTLKASAEGEKVWEKTFGGSGFDLGKSIVSAKDGGWAMTGWTESEVSGSRDLWLIKIKEEP
ncbi:MAG TPA: hypothetical protein PLY09_00055 [Methanothrix sp.]|nr:hypothetical protein [Methanothrix sp.]HPJ83134.1 hypothetical protein [Methanothrix sp.]